MFVYQRVDQLNSFLGTGFQSGKIFAIFIGEELMQSKFFKEGMY